MFSYVIHLQAEKDVLRAVRWYRRIDPYLGRRFAADFDATVARIIAMPLGFSRFDARHRFAKLKKFRYLVLFRVGQAVVHIVGVGHASRSGRYWGSRTK
jgi:hypothetical protein